MNKFNLFSKAVLSVTICTVLFSACKKDDDKPSPTPPAPNAQALEVKEYETSRITSYGNDWVYFSFKEGKEVKVDEASHNEDLSWDVAFNRFNMRTNSGVSGKGKGGAVDAKETDMAKVVSAPAEGYKTDEKAFIMFGLGDMMSGGKPEMGESSLNPVLKEAIKKVDGVMPPQYNISKQVFIVKTADGKYAKILFTGYHDKKGKAGIVSFKYAYQADGSKNLK